VATETTPKREPKKKSTMHLTVKILRTIDVTITAAGETTITLKKKSIRIRRDLKATLNASALALPRSTLAKLTLTVVTTRATSLGRMTDTVTETMIARGEQMSPLVRPGTEEKTITWIKKEINIGLKITATQTLIVVRIAEATTKTTTKAETALLRTITRRLLTMTLTKVKAAAAVDVIVVKELIPSRLIAVVVNLLRIGSRATEVEVTIEASPLLLRIAVMEVTPSLATRTTTAEIRRAERGPEKAVCDLF
jgi:hypothetical protein